MAENILNIAIDGSETDSVNGTTFSGRESLVNYTKWGVTTGTQTYTVEEDNMILMVLCRYHASINSGSLGDWEITGNTGNNVIVYDNELVSNTANNFDNKVYGAILYPNKGDIITCSYTSPSGNTGENMMYLSIQIDKLIGTIGSLDSYLLGTAVCSKSETDAYGTTKTVNNSITLSAGKYLILTQAIGSVSGSDSTTAWQGVNWNINEIEVSGGTIVNRESVVAENAYDSVDDRYSNCLVSYRIDEVIITEDTEFTANCTITGYYCPSIDLRFFVFYNGSDIITNGSLYSYGMEIVDMDIDMSNWSNTDVSTECTATKESDHILLDNGTNSQAICLVGSMNTIDFVNNNYTKLCANGIWNGSEFTLELDVSSVSGEYYVNFVLFTSSNTSYLQLNITSTKTNYNNTNRIAKQNSDSYSGASYKSAKLYKLWFE